jgi:hypothetical protein
MSSKLVSFEKVLSSQLKNTIVLNVVRVVLVIYILMITSIPVSILVIFENTLFQVFYLALLAYMALVDPASALLMAAAYLFTVQKLNQPEVKMANHVTQKMNNNKMNNNKMNNNNMNNNNKMNNNNMNNNNMMNNNMMNNNMMNNNSLNNMLMNNNRENFGEPVANNLTMAPALAIASETHSEHPAYQTMTDNLASGTTFTTDLQFKDAQSNAIPNIDQTTGIKSWTNQFSAQGVDLPRGFDADIYRGAEL